MQCKTNISINELYLNIFLSQLQKAGDWLQLCKQVNAIYHLHIFITGMKSIVD